MGERKEVKRMGVGVGCGEGLIVKQELSCPLHIPLSSRTCNSTSSPPCPCRCAALFSRSRAALWALNTRVDQRHVILRCILSHALLYPFWQPSPPGEPCNQCPTLFFSLSFAGRRRSCGNQRTPYAKLDEVRTLPSLLSQTLPFLHAFSLI